MPRPQIRTRQAVDPLTAYQMVLITEGVVERGTARTLRDLGRPMMGKTGTTTGPTDVWFIGGTPQMIGGLYLGYDNPRKRSEEHKSALQSLMRISYAVFCLKKQTTH